VRAPSKWVRHNWGREAGVTWAKAVLPFQVGKARTKREGPSSWMGSAASSAPYDDMERERFDV
jgi:hypothetical protein